eukprot:400521_1
MESHLVIKSIQFKPKKVNTCKWKPKKDDKHRDVKCNVCDGTHPRKSIVVHFDREVAKGGDTKEKHKQLYDEYVAKKSLFVQGRKKHSTNKLKWYSSMILYHEQNDLHRFGFVMRKKHNKVNEKPQPP